jgi:hypothetical protein
MKIKAPRGVGGRGKEKEKEKEKYRIPAKCFTLEHQPRTCLAPAEVEMSTLSTE